LARRTLVLFAAATLTLSMRAAAQCSNIGNTLGSVPYPPGGPYQGVAFQLWAPNATSVNVAGDFNGWSGTANPLTSEANGLWCANVARATVGQKYHYLLSSSQFGTVTRRDANSRTVTVAKNGDSIIYDTAAYFWQDPTFTPPPLDKLVIYEMHVGTFNATRSALGTFQSAISELDHVSALGFNAVEVLPVTQFDGIYANPYGPTDEYAIDNDEYGGPDNFKAFVDACHQRGLAVLVDIVHNHWAVFDVATYRYDGWHTSAYPGGIYFWL
jgi:1,4-alpha-glucan branching enzyme